MPVGALPGELSRFIGRERELAELEELAGRARLVTLTGPGGSGKTRLALELAGRLPKADREVVVFIDLAPVTDVDVMVPTIAGVVGTSSTSPQASVDSLIEAIGARRLLLLLDNLEQLTGAGRVIAEVLAGCPGVRILATSRSPLHVRGEREYPVGPLALPAQGEVGSIDVLGRVEAIALFVERARQISPRFDLTDENASAVAEICRRLDGLPLAIELAAGQTRLLSPDALLHRLERSLPLPTAGPTDAPARQRTLHDTIAWSYGLLDVPDRIVFARVSVFVGGFELPDAEAVFPDPGDPAKVDVIASLSRLVDVNLVRVAAGLDMEPRFNLLETIREFATEQLTDAETDVLRARHARRFADVAEASLRNVGGSERASWLRRVRADDGPDLANVRNAVEWSRRGDLDEHVRLVVATPLLLDNLHGGWEALDAAEAMAERADPATRAHLLNSLALYAMLYGGDRVQSRALFSEALRLYEELGNQTGMATTLRDLAAADFDLGDRVRGTSEIERALALARGVEDPLEATRLLSQVASIYIPTHPPAEGLPLAREVLQRATAIDYMPEIASGYGYVGMVLLAIGDLHGAVSALAESVRMWLDLGQETDMAHETLAMLGVARLRAGQFDESRALLATAAAHARQSGIVWRGLAALEGQADWLGALGRAEPATVCWAAIDVIRTKTRDRTAFTDHGMAASSRARDRSALTAAEYRKARALGAALTLPEALDYATRALDETTLPAAEAVNPTRRSHHDLTPREREVLALLVDGRSDGQIAEALYISKKTAAVHVANIKGKLGASSRVEIVTKALSLGLAGTPRHG